MNNEEKQALDDYLTHDYREDFQPACKKCVTDLEWITCWNCSGSGFTHHDCGEDTCMCICPEDNVQCDTCGGEEGWYKCPTCKKREMATEIQDNHANTGSHRVDS